MSTRTEVIEWQDVHRGLKTAERILDRFPTTIDFDILIDSLKYKFEATGLTLENPIHVWSLLSAATYFYDNLRADIQRMSQEHPEWANVKAVLLALDTAFAMTFIAYRRYIPDEARANPTYEVELETPITRPESLNWGMLKSNTSVEASIKRYLDELKYREPTFYTLQLQEYDQVQAVIAEAGVSQPETAYCLIFAPIYIGAIFAKLTTDIMASSPIVSHILVNVAAVHSVQLRSLPKSIRRLLG